MHDLLVNFANRAPDWTIWATDDRPRKKAIKVNDLIRVRDEHGNVCGGFVDRIDERTRLVHIVLDRSTYESVKHA